MTITMGTSRQHGTESRYTYGCRCEVCTLAASEARKDREARRAAGLIRAKARTTASAKHGTTARYTRGCKCKPCLAAWAAYHREWRARRAAQS